MILDKNRRDFSVYLAERRAADPLPSGLGDDPLPWQQTIPSLPSRGYNGLVDSRGVHMARLKGATIVLLAAVLPAAEAEVKAADAATSAVSRQELIEAMKQLQEDLGFRRTDNFTHRSEKLAADYRCYFTGRFELPDSYDGLKLKTGSKEGCALDAVRYDVFFYPVEAVASGKAPLTAGLEQAPLERFLIVVSHEDVHSGPEVDKLPVALSEAATALMGFLSAVELAREQFGADSDLARRLSREPELFLKKAEVVNRVHAELACVYAAYAQHRMTEAEAIAKKQRLFAEAERACNTAEFASHAFNPCLSAANNAGLAFDYTYTRHYPLLFEVYRAYRGQSRPTIDAIRWALSVKKEAQVLERLAGLLAHASQ